MGLLKGNTAIEIDSVRIDRRQEFIAIDSQNPTYHYRSERTSPGASTQFYSQVRNGRISDLIHLAARFKVARNVTIQDDRWSWDAWRAI
jgi:hypothetical protein